MVTRRPPRTPCKITPPRAIKPRLRTHFRSSLMRTRRRGVLRRRTVLRLLWCGRRGLRLSAGALRFGCTGRRRPLRTTGEFGALFQPRLVILRRIDHECAFHSVMPKTAKLAANHFVGPGLYRRKPDRNE